MRLSIVIATFNRGSQLLDTLSSLLAQTVAYEEWECVVVNNNSTDNTQELFDNFHREYPTLNIRMVTETKQGLSNARNRGIAESVGDVVAIIDDDETVNPDFVKGYIDLFETYPDAAAAGGRVVPEFMSERPSWMTSFTERPIAGTLDLGADVKPFVKGYPAGGNMALSRRATEQYGVFDTSLGRTGTKLLGGEEKELMNRYAERGGKIYYTPVPVIFHRIPDSKLTDAYFSRLTYMCGVSERARTRSVSKGVYCKAVVAEGCKWVATLALAAGYLLMLETPKASKLIEMRRQVSKGLLGK